MKRILLCSLILASAGAAFACASKSGGGGNGGTAAAPPDGTDPGSIPPPEPPPPEEEGGVSPEAAPAQGGEDPSGNPILLGAPRLVRTFTPPGGMPYFVDGPQWSAVRSQLFVSLPFAANIAGGKGILATFKSDGTNYTEVRAGDLLTTGVIGNTLDKEGNLVSAELKSITRTPITAAGVGLPTVIATKWVDALGTENNFDTPNDLVALDDGTIYVTDPGYEVLPRPATGHLFRIASGTTWAVIAATYDFNPSPNGIALSKDQKTLFVGFTAPAEGTPPFVRKYTISGDRTLTDAGKFVEVPVDSSPDGLAVDDKDNLYVALKSGIAVFKSTGEPYGGASAKVPQTALDGEPTSLTFGAADRKSLFVTTKGGKVFELKTKVPGLLQ